MTWPQYFDGAGWDNKISKSYGIDSIPAAWLIDKKGMLRETGLHGEALGAGVEKLLAGIGTRAVGRSPSVLLALVTSDACAGRRLVCLSLSATAAGASRRVTATLAGKRPALERRDEGRRRCALQRRV